MTAPRRPILLLVNPVSGGKPAAPGATAGRPAPGDLRDLLRGHGLNVDLHLLEEGDDVAALASGAVAGGRDVVVAGGDGTVRPTASALVETDATLGIIPFGSWNNIARGCGLPVEPAAAIAVIAAGDRRLVDVGRAWHPGTPPEDGVDFFEAAGVGLDAAGFGAAQAGARAGIWRAVRSAWRALRRRRTTITLVVDGRELRTAAPAVTVCNGPYFGLGFALAPEADPSDGMLDVVVFSGMSRSAVIRHYLAVARGRPRRDPRVNRIRARRVSIAGVHRTLPAHADGESIGTTPVTFGVTPGGLRVFAAPPQLPGSPLAAAASAPNTRA